MTDCGVAGQTGKDDKPNQPAYFGNDEQVARQKKEPNCRKSHGEVRKFTAKINITGEDRLNFVLAVKIADIVTRLKPIHKNNY